MNPYDAPPPGAPPPPPRQGPPPRNGWRTFGIVLAVFCGIGGLVLVGAAILFMVSMNAWANNK